MHNFNGEPYYLGAFLLGAYQEILGDMHNLFGDTNAVHVSMDDEGEVILETVIKGDTVREVLDYVEFNVESLMRQLRSSVEVAVREVAHQLRGSRPLPAVLRRRPARLHLSGRAAREVGERPEARGQR